MRLAVLCGLTIFVSGVVSTAEEPTFDAASVKLASPDQRPPFPITGGPGTNDPGRFSATRIGMVGLLLRAFDLAGDQIVGPAWLRVDPQHPANTPNYTVVATMPPGTTKEQFQKMLQSLLVERFHLAFHHETRNFPGYELAVDNGGPKFKEVPLSQPAKSDTDRDPRAVLSGPHGDDGFPVAPGPRRFSQNRPGGDARWKFQEWTMAEFAVNLAPLVAASQGRHAATAFPVPPLPRVTDRTGLTGKYTFVLEFYDADMANLNLSALFGRGGGASDTGNGPVPAASEPGGAFPNIFVAVQKQLGLRLDKTADVPLDVIVVDSVDKIPAEN
jgi:uncharacterized protein (TIGR03435 family)